MELDLQHTIFEPVETHVNGFGAFLLDGLIYNSDSGGFVCLERGLRLLVDHLLQGMEKGDGGFCIFKKGADFLLCG